VSAWVAAEDFLGRRAHTGHDEADRAMTPRPLPDSPFNALRIPMVVTAFSVDDRVSHDTYGIGTVVTVESDQAMTIDFGDRQVRVVTPFRKVTRLSP
jgi:hypothetical protein